MRKIALLLLFCLTLPVLAHSQERPFLDASRGQLALGANYEFFQGSGSTVSPLSYDKEWTVGAYGSWNMVRELDAIGFTKLGLDNHVWNSAIGIRYTIWAGVR